MLCMYVCGFGECGPVLVSRKLPLSPVSPGSSSLSQMSFCGEFSVEDMYLIKYNIPAKNYPLF